jgi:hypothetical protein
MTKLLYFPGIVSLMVLTLLAGCEKEGADQTANVGNSEPAQTSSLAATENISVDEARTIAREAYIYGFPMVMNYKTIYNYVVDTQNPEYKGPFNQLAHRKTKPS